MRHSYNDIVDEVVRFFRGNCVPGDGCPVVVTTAGRIGDQLVGEYYAFVCDQTSTFYQQRATLDSPAASVLKDDHQTALDPSLMVDFLTQLAEEQLNSHLYERQKHHTESAFSNHFYRLESANAKQLLYLKLRGSYAAHLQRIARDTQFTGLARIIRGLEVLQVADITEIEQAGEGA